MEHRTVVDGETVSPQPGCSSCGDWAVVASLLRVEGHREGGGCFRYVDRLAKRKHSNG